MKIAAKFEKQNEILRREIYNTTQHTSKQLNDFHVTGINNASEGRNMVDS